MLRLHTVHFGCRANQADSAAITEELLQEGFQTVDDYRQADVVVLNSCTVTAAADSELRQTIRRIHRRNQHAKILVTGCYAQRRPQDLSSLPGVRWIVGNTRKHEIGRLVSAQARGSGSSHWLPLERLLATAQPFQDVAFHSLSAHLPHPEPPFAGPEIVVGDVSQQRELTPAPVVCTGQGDRTRPNLKVQDGCNNRCSFCIIPSVRGRSRSLPPGEILRQIRSLCAAGYREVVLSGINLGRYGRDFAERIRFARLVRMILEETPLERLRLSSVEPMDFAEELLDLMAGSPRIARHVHAPLQSGSDRILQRMHRKYQARHYRDRILAAYRRMPNAAFGADVMVGFPGETEEDFELTRSLIDSLPFTYLHVFPFSRRSGTPADTMPDQVAGTAVRQRSRILRELATEKNRHFQERQVGRTLRVLTLGETSREGTTALSGNYLRVLLQGVRLPSNRIVAVRIVSLADGVLVGNPPTGASSHAPSPESSATASPSITTIASA